MEGFSKSMSGEALCAFLEEQGLEEDDLAKIRAKGYDGTSILLLSQDESEELDDLHLTAAGNMVLEILFEDECPNEDEPPCPPRSEMAFPPPTNPPVSTSEGSQQTAVNPAFPPSSGNGFSNQEFAPPSLDALIALQQQEARSAANPPLSNSQQVSGVAWENRSLPSQQPPSGAQQIHPPNTMLPYPPMMGMQYSSEQQVGPPPTSQGYPPTSSGQMQTSQRQMMAKQKTFPPFGQIQPDQPDQTSPTPGMPVSSPKSEAEFDYLPSSGLIHQYPQQSQEYPSGAQPYPSFQPLGVFLPSSGSPQPPSSDTTASGPQQACSSSESQAYMAPGQPPMSSVPTQGQPPSSESLPYPNFSLASGVQHVCPPQPYMTHGQPPISSAPAQESLPYPNIQLPGSDVSTLGPQQVGPPGSESYQNLTSGQASSSVAPYPSYSLQNSQISTEQSSQAPPATDQRTVQPLVVPGNQPGYPLPGLSAGQQNQQVKQEQPVALAESIKIHAVGEEEPDGSAAGQGKKLVKSHTLEALEEAQEYIAFGLGFGVDATDPSPLRCKHGQVRKVLSDLTNVQETSKREKKAYEEIISSMVDYSVSVSSSVSELIAQGLSLSAEGGVARQKGNELIVQGQKITIREVRFKPFRSRDYYNPSLAKTKDSVFEADLCKYLVEEIPDIEGYSGDTDAEKVQLYLRETPDKNDVVHKTYIFIKSEGVTHYISRISLGATKYSICTYTKTAISVGGKVGLGVEFIAKAGIGGRVGKENVNIVSKDHQIGDFDNVKRGSGEAVIGYEILPVYMLCRREELKKVIQEATKLYLERESGPFIIKCGRNYEKYLQVTRIDNKNGLIATDVKEEASPFHIEKSVCPEEYYIAHYGGRGPKGSPTNQPLYVHTNSKLTGKEEGPLKVGVNRGANFVLSNVNKEEKNLSLSQWENTACYIRCAPRKAQHKSYLALDEDSDFIMCVPERKSQNKGNISMLFQIERVRVEESNRTTIYRAPVMPVGQVELSYEDVLDSEEEEEEYNFEYEFQQVVESNSATAPSSV